MSAKDELNQYRYARRKVDETLEEYEKYKTRAEKMTSIISSMPRGGQTSDKVADNATKMADLSKEYEKRWLEAENGRLEIERNIDRVPEPYRTLLHMRYIESLNFERIADRMGYTYSAITKMHGNGLLKYEQCKKVQDSAN